MHRYLLLTVLYLLSTVLAVSLAACRASDASDRQMPLRILTGTEGGVYYRFGSALARAAASQMPNVAPVVGVSGGSVSNIEAIEKGHGEVALAQSDATYSAFEQGTDRSPYPHTHLRAVARLYPNAVQVMVRADGPLRNIADLAGRRIGANEPGAGIASRTTRQVLESYGIPPERIHLQSRERAELLQGLRDGSFEAVVAVSGYPSPVMVEIASALDARLIGMEDDAIHEARSRRPFFRSIVIPPRTYRGQEDAVKTVGVDTVLICRDTLDEQVAFELARTFFDALPRIAEAVPGAGSIDADHAPATPIPLHPGAARYYRERELFQ